MTCYETKVISASIEHVSKLPTESPASLGPRGSRTAKCKIALVVSPAGSGSASVSGSERLGCRHHPSLILPSPLEWDGSVAGNTFCRCTAFAELWMAK